MSSIQAKAIRSIILKQSKRANVGHIGSSLCVADIIAALYGNILNIHHPDDPNRDRFILSKGHAALALYAALHLKGWLTEDELNQYCADASLLGVHPERALKGIDFSTGSLGLGLSFAAGAALGSRLKNAGYRAFALLSDAECNEGSVWEAAMFAAHHQLSNLIAIIDLNAQQAFGYTREVINMEPVAERWKAFGWDVHTIDGHYIDEITRTIKSLNVHNGPPHIILAKTIFGKGVSYMENQIKWHYWPMSDDEYIQALKDINT